MSERTLRELRELYANARRYVPGNEYMCGRLTALVDALRIVTDDDARTLKGAQPHGKEE